MIIIQIFHAIREDIHQIDMAEIGRAVVCDDDFEINYSARYSLWRVCGLGDIDACDFNLTGASSIAVTLAAAVLGFAFHGDCIQ